MITFLYFTNAKYTVLCLTIQLYEKPTEQQKPKVNRLKISGYRQTCTTQHKNRSRLIQAEYKVLSCTEHNIKYKILCHVLNTKYTATVIYCSNTNNTT